MTTPRKSALPPGSKRHWLLGIGIGQVKDPLGQLVRGHQQYGDIVYFHMHHGPSWLLSHPDHAQYVLADNASNFLNMVSGERDPLLGRGLFASNGDFWRRQRRMVQSAFHRPRLALMVDGLVRDAQRFAERWGPHSGTGTPLEMLVQMRRLVISMLGNSIFTEDIYESQEALRTGMDDLGKLVHGRRDSLLEAIRGLLGIHGARMKVFFNSVEQINTGLYRLIAERRQSPAGKDDILTMLMEAKDTQGVAMTDLELRDELVNLFIGGYESTAVALTWILYEVANHPEVEQRVRGELATVLEGRALTAESLQSLHYTRAVVEETLRVHPPAWNFVRRSVKEDEIGGFTMARGHQGADLPLHPAPAPRVLDGARALPPRALPPRAEGRPAPFRVPALRRWPAAVRGQWLHGDAADGGARHAVAALPVAPGTESSSRGDRRQHPPPT